jgi:hypothetical protein
MDYDDDFYDGPPNSPDEMAIWLSEFMTAADSAAEVYRNHVVTLIANKVYSDFGYEGFCELMVAMDKKAGWISDIIIENSDLDDIMFKKYGTYDHRVIHRARGTDAIQELNQKIWRLRRKYAKAIVDELMAEKEDLEGETPTS